VDPVNGSARGRQTRCFGLACAEGAVVHLSTTDEPALFPSLKPPKHLRHNKQCLILKLHVLCGAMNRTGLKVLLVDDSIELLERLVEMLSHVPDLDIVGQVTSVADARAILPKLHADLVILDLQLRDGSGFDVLRELRASHPQTKVIVFTNHPEEQYRRRCSELGVTHFLTKSTDSRLLIELAEQEQASLTNNEERYRDYFENAKDAIYVHDLDGRYTMVNKAGEALIGYTHEEILKLSVFDVVPQNYAEQIQARLKMKLADHTPTIYEVEAIRKDGTRVPVEVSSRLIWENGVPVAVQGSARDITERKRAEEALRASQLQLQQSQKLEAVGQLAGGVAHDFNNLLTAIIGYTDLSLRRNNLEDSIRHNLEETKKAAERAGSLIRQLLAFSRKQILEPKVLDLNAVVKDMHKMLTRLIGENIDLATRQAADLGRVKADPSQVEQIIMNLVVNARDAMPQGGKVTIETANITLDDQAALKHVSVKAGEYVMLAVSDTGTGIDEETQARIFEPFFTTKEVGRGTGLGLSTVYGIVKQSGGNIWVYSEQGVGTVFKVYLPRVDAAASIIEKLVLESAAPQGTETILLVEDEDVVRGLARKILSEAGYKVLEARSGAEAIELSRGYAGPIDLLLTDVVMPVISGKEVAERLKELRPAARVLFMSGYTDEAVVRHGVLDANVEFLQKPFTWVRLAKKVRDVLDRQQINSSSESHQA
jgi:two-component system cell cycle sensor histidine kinase/response regulator CckA